MIYSRIARGGGAAARSPLSSFSGPRPPPSSSSSPPSSPGVSVCLCRIRAAQNKPGWQREPQRRDVGAPGEPVLRTVQRKTEQRRQRLRFSRQTH